MRESRLEAGHPRANAKRASVVSADSESTEHLNSAIPRLRARETWKIISTCKRAKITRVLINDAGNCGVIIEPFRTATPIDELILLDCSAVELMTFEESLTRVGMFFAADY